MTIEFGQASTTPKSSPININNKLIPVFPVKAHQSNRSDDPAQAIQSRDIMRTSRNNDN